MTKPIKSVTVNFSDGRQVTIISDDSEEGTAFYKKEEFAGKNGILDIHTVFIAGGLERKLPHF